MRVERSSLVGEGRRAKAVLCATFDFRENRLRAVQIRTRLVWSTSMHARHAVTRTRLSCGRPRRARHDRARRHARRSAVSCDSAHAFDGRRPFDRRGSPSRRFLGSRSETTTLRRAICADACPPRADGSAGARAAAAMDPTAMMNPMVFGARDGGRDAPGFGAERADARTARGGGLVLEKALPVRQRACGRPLQRGRGGRAGVFRRPRGGGRAGRAPRRAHHRRARTIGLLECHADGRRAAEEPPPAWGAATSRCSAKKAEYYHAVAAAVREAQTNGGGGYSRRVGRATALAARRASSAHGDAPSETRRRAASALRSGRQNLERG